MDFGHQSVLQRRVIQRLRRLCDPNISTSARYISARSMVIRIGTFTRFYKIMDTKLLEPLQFAVADRATWISLPTDLCGI